MSVSSELFNKDLEKQENTTSKQTSQQNNKKDESMKETVEALKPLTPLQALVVVSFYPQDSKEFLEAADLLSTKGSNNLFQINSLQQKYKEYVERLLKDINSSLDRKKIMELPNIYVASPRTLKYYRFKYLLENLISDNVLQNKFPRDILGHLNQLLTSKQASHIILTAALILLAIHYGKGGKKLISNISAIKSQIKEFLSNPSNSMGSQVPIELIPALVCLKEYLNHSNRALRLEAREIAEGLNIPLKLTKMIPLSVDGVATDTGEKVKNLVLVIGGTGVGKSTMINYLSGVDFNYVKFEATNTPYLEPKVPKTGDIQRVPAKMGHGATSQTLYPQIIRNEEFSFADVAGFEDNRDDEQSTCATLSVPFAARYADSVRAIIVVLEYDTTSVNSGGKGANLRLLMKTLAEIIPHKEIKKFPILFAITKPPMPNYASMMGDEGEVIEPKPFDPATVRGWVKGRLEQIWTEKYTNNSDIEEKQKLVEETKSEIADIDVTISKLAIYLNGDKQISAQHNPFAFVFSKLSSTIKEGQDSAFIKEQVDYLRTQNLRDGVLLRLERILPQIIKKSDQTEQRRAIEYHKDLLENEKKETKEKCNKREKEWEELLGEKFILELLKNSSDNTFIIRGYSFPHYKDLQDDKEALLNCLRKLQKEGKDIKKESLVFDSSHRKFDLARIWTRENVNQNLPKFKGIVSLPDRINKSKSEVNEAQIQMKLDQEKLGNELKSKEGVPPKEIVQPLEDSIKRSQEQRTDYIGERDKLIGDNKAYEEAIQKILNDKTLKEYGSKHNIEERSWLGWLFGSRTTWEYEANFRLPVDIFRQAVGIDKADAYLPESVVKDLSNRLNSPLSMSSWQVNIPIARIELSCSISGDKKIVFRNSIKSGHIEDGNDLSSIATNEYDNVMNIDHLLGVSEYRFEDNHGRTGEFVIHTNNLDLGKFSVTYYSDKSESGYSAVRLFVLKRYLPSKIQEMSNFRSEINANHGKILDLQEKIKLLDRRIENDEAHLQLLKKGGLDKIRQQSVINEVKKLLFRLDYHKTEFLKEFFKELSDSEIKNLEDEKVYKELVQLTHCSDTQYRELLGLKKTTRGAFCTQMGLEIVPPNSEATHTNSDEEVNELLKRVPKEFIQKLFNISLKTGLTITTLRNLICWKQEVIANEEPWKTYIKRLEIKCITEEVCYQILRNYFDKQFSTIQAVNTVISVLNFGKDDVVSKFVKKFNEIQELRKTADNKFVASGIWEEGIRQIEANLRRYESEFGLTETLFREAQGKENDGSGNATTKANKPLLNQYTTSQPVNSHSSQDLKKDGKDKPMQIIGQSSSQKAYNF